MNSKQLDLVIRLASEQRDAAAARLAAARAQWQSATEQLQQLQAYQAQYVAQAQRESQQGISVQALSEGRRFIAELDDLIATQNSTVAQQASAMETQAEHWTEAARYLQSVERFKVLKLNEQAVANQRREQQQADDLYAIRRSALASGTG